MVAHRTIYRVWEPWFPETLERPFGRRINYQFMVGNVQGVYDRVKTAGRAPFIDIHDTEVWKTDCVDTRRQFVIFDPDGYPLRFAQSLKTRPIEDKDLQRLDEKYATNSL